MPFDVVEGMVPLYTVRDPDSFNANERASAGIIRAPEKRSERAMAYYIIEAH
jgi:hypothetical protein